MKRKIALFLASASLLAACGPNPVTNLVGSYSGTATIVWERYASTTPVNATVSIFEAPEGKVSIVATGKETQSSTRPLQLTCRLTATPNTTGFVIEAGSNCVVEGTVGNCNGTLPVATIVAASAVRTQLGMTIDTRV